MTSSEHDFDLDAEDELEEDLDPAGAQAAAAADGRTRAAREALARARTHGRRAAAEAALALRALIEAGSLALLGTDPALHGGVAGRLADLLDELARRLSDERPDGERLLDAIAEALDAEVGRWEERAEEDPEARAVLRAYLGLRELLWELGVRRSRRSSRGAEPPEPAAAAPVESARPGRGGGGRRVQRVRVEG